jgi:hypothetical protein
MAQKLLLVWQAGFCVSKAAGGYLCGRVFLAWTSRKMPDTGVESCLLDQKDRQKHGKGQAGNLDIAKKGLESPENLGRLCSEGINPRSNPQSPVLK